MPDTDDKCIMLYVQRHIQMCRQCAIRLQQIRTQFLAPHLLNQFHEVALQYDVDQLGSLHRQLSACKSVHVCKELNCFLHKEHKNNFGSGFWSLLAKNNAI